MNETDSELLQFAAKAAGFDEVLPYRWMEKTFDDLWCRRAKQWFRWNPLTDDGDAFRLAVKLGLKVSSYVYFSDKCQLSATATAAMPSGSSWIDQPIGRFPEYTESHVKHDPYAATRRAIVRAAAEIGRTIK
jgi:hypothetical protein